MFGFGHCSYVYVCVYMCMCISMYFYLYVCIYTYLCISCRYTCIYIYTVYRYTHMYTPLHSTQRTKFGKEYLLPCTVSIMWQGRPKLHSLTGWWLTYSSEKYQSQLGLLFLIYGKPNIWENNPNVPHHQADHVHSQRLLQVLVAVGSFDHADLPPVSQHTSKTLMNVKRYSREMAIATCNCCHCH